MVPPKQIKHQVLHIQTQSVLLPKLAEFDGKTDQIDFGGIVIVEDKSNGK